MTERARLAVVVTLLLLPCAASAQAEGEPDGETETQGEGEAQPAEPERTTDAPETTDAPDTTDEPEPTDAPETTDEPEPTDEPEMSDEEAEAAYLARMYGADDAPEDDEETPVSVPPVGDADYLGYAALGVGALGILGGLVTRMLAPRAFERAERGGPGADARRSEGEALEIGSATLFAAGGALALTGLIVLYVRLQEREAARYGALRIRLGIDGVTLAGRF